jgi:hypothetical protein
LINHKVARRHSLSLQRLYQLKLIISLPLLVPHSSGKVTKENKSTAKAVKVLLLSCSKIFTKGTKGSRRLINFLAEPRTCLAADRGAKFTQRKYFLYFATWRLPTYTAGQVLRESPKSLRLSKQYSQFSI